MLQIRPTDPGQKTKRRAPIYRVGM